MMVAAEPARRRPAAPELRELVREACRKFPERVAFLNERRRWTFQELGERVRRLAALFDALDVTPRDTIGLVLSPRMELLYETRVAAYEHGAALFGISPMLSPPELARLLRAVAPRVVLYDGDMLPHLPGLLREAAPGVRSLAAVGPAGDYEGRLAAMPDRDSRNAIAAGSLAALGFTSGTTGAPKGITATHGALAESCRMFLEVLDRSGIRGPGTFFNAMPLFAAGGGMIVPALATGLTLRVQDRFAGAGALALLEGDRAAVTFVTPSMLIDLLDEDLESRNLSALRLLIYGSAATPAAKVEEAIRRLGSRLLHGYGMSECLPPVAVLWPAEHGTREHPADRATLRSVGRPFDGVRVRIEDETGNSLTAGNLGEIVISSPTVTGGYWNDPERTAAALRDGWWRSGDLGFMDERGRLSILDRKPDVLRRGERIFFPRAIEEEASDHPWVKEACAVADGAGRIVLAVSLRRLLRGRAAAAPAVLSSFLEGRLEPEARPDEIRVFPELPRSVQGKVLKREIRDALARES